MKNLAILIALGSLSLSLIGCGGGFYNDGYGGPDVGVGFFGGGWGGGGGGGHHSGGHHGGGHH